MSITIKHVISFEPATLAVLNRLADAIEGKTQDEIDAAAAAIGEVTTGLKTSSDQLAAALSK